MLSFLPEGFKPKSFRARLTSAAAVTSLAVLAVVWLLLGRMFEDHIERLIEDDLQSRMLEIAGLLQVDEAGRPNLVAEPADPRYQRPAGGAYWRIEEGGKTIVRSFSLWDFDFTPSKRSHLSPTGVASEQHGPNGSTVYLAKRDVTLDGVRGPHDLRVEVALDTSNVQRLRTSFERQTVIALGVIGLALSLGIWIQSSFALRPLNAIREQLNRIHGGLDSRMKGQFPQEIAPLVDDLNKLLARQEDLVRRARERAGDLAHGLKTPLTLLQIEASNAQQRGDARTAASLREQVAIMNRHIERELRRARMSGAAAGGGAFVDARETVDRLIRTVQRMPGGEALAWQDQIAVDARLRMDPDDFGEIVGNILDNARKHARSRVRISVDSNANAARICFDDDGPGIPIPDRDRIIRRGERADADGEGSGLGLSIVIEALGRYNVQLSIEDSPLGGCRICFPAIGWSAVSGPKGVAYGSTRSNPWRRPKAHEDALDSSTKGPGSGSRTVY